MALGRVNCRACGKEYQKEYHSHIYCSSECRPYMKKATVTAGVSRECLYCNKSFISEQPSQYFCNDECFRLYRKNKREVRKLTKCAQCGKDFARTKQLTKYCSDDCRRAYNGLDELTDFPGYKPFECPYASGRLPEEVSRNTLYN